MYTILRSALFKRQLIHFVKNYKDRAGIKVASNFIDNLEKSIEFIGENPYSCLMYTEIAKQEFRKWNVKNFPHAIFFRVNENIITLEVLYAQKMDINSRILNDINQN